MKKPIIIAGGGLAGLSLGIALQSRGVPVTIHEASIYPRHRVCGEFISGVSKETLDALGVSDCLDGATSLETATWSDRTGRLVEMKVPGRGISRWKLDDLLQRKFLTLGGTLLTNSRRAPDAGVIWAAGRPRQDSDWIGLKCHARNLRLTHDLEMFTSPGGYIGLARIEDDKVNICGLFKRRDPGSAKRFDLLSTMLRECTLQKVAERLEAAEIDESSFCGVAAFQTGWQPGPDFSIGDAASMIPPFTGNGMSMAFESAECALQPAMDYAAGRKSWQEAASASTAAQASKFRSRLAFANALHKAIMNPLAICLVGNLARCGVLPLQRLVPFLR